jgi:hypothetical protein
MARKVYEKSNNQWLKDLSKLVLDNVRQQSIVISDAEEKLMFPFVLPKNIAPVPKVPIQELQPASRFDS